MRLYYLFVIKNVKKPKLWIANYETCIPQESELDIPLPKSMDPPSIQKFFMEQVQVGEEKLGMGKSIFSAYQILDFLLFDIFRLFRSV